jgi:hypothetical protein
MCLNAFGQTLCSCHPRLLPLLQNELQQLHHECQLYVWQWHRIPGGQLVLELPPFGQCIITGGHVMSGACACRMRNIVQA